MAKKREDYTEEELALLQAKDEQNEKRLAELEELLGFRLFTTEKVNAVGIHRDTLIKDVKAGRVPAYYNGKLYLIREEDFCSYVGITPLRPKSSTPQPERFEDMQFIWLSLNDIALLMRRKKTSISQDIHAGRLRAFRPGGGTDIRILKEAFLEYLELFRYVPEK